MWVLLEEIRGRGSGRPHLHALWGWGKTWDSDGGQTLEYPWLAFPALSVSYLPVYLSSCFLFHIWNIHKKLRVWNVLSDWETNMAHFSWILWLLRIPVLEAFLKGISDDECLPWFSRPRLHHVCAFHMHKEQHRLCTQNRAGESEAQMETESCDDNKWSCTNVPVVFLNWPWSVFLFWQLPHHSTSCNF